jgi:tetratricopeptide (TPR) repeat protein
MGDPERVPHPPPDEAELAEATGHDDDGDAEQQQAATPPSTDPRAKPTEREPAVTMGDPEKVLETPPIAAAAVVEIKPPAPSVEPTPSSVTQPSVPAVGPKPVVEKEVPIAVAQVPAAPESFKPARADEAREAAPKVEEPKKAAPAKVEEPKKAAPAKAPEPAKAAPAKAAEPAKAAAAKAQEPAKAAPAKVEEPKKAAPAKAEEPKKAVPAKVEEPKKGTPSKEDAKSASAKKHKPEDPGARRPGSLRAVPALEEDLDASSISAEFFRKDQDSVPPVEEHEEEVDAVPVQVLSPTTIARRARLRRLVAGVVAFAGVITIAVVGKQVAAPKRIVPPTAFAVEARHDTPPAPTAEEAKPVEPAKTTVAVADKAPAPEPNKADEPKPDEAKKDEPKPDEAKKDDAKTLSAADVAALKKETLSLLNRGKNKDAIAKAQEAIAADPTDADLYLYLGSALQDTGKWKEGIEAFSECVRNAKKGPVHDCRQFGGHK